MSFAGLLRGALFFSVREPVISILCGDAPL
jgi:hypothetical protein